MRALKKDTLAYHLGVRPWTIGVDISSAPLSRVVNSYSQYLDTNKLNGGVVAGVDDSAVGKPEVDALIFYVLNHAVSIVKQKVHPLEPLGIHRATVELYNRQLSMRSVRMFYYLLVICTRESRHEKTDSHFEFWEMLETQYSKEVVDFCMSLRGKSSLQAADTFKSTKLVSTLGNYTAFLEDVFNKGKFNTGYGGKAWGAVAEVLNKYVHGVISAEVMMDTAFTLCHNNGPIFNKGILFESYTSSIYKILDVQRSGQIPQFIYKAENSYTKNKDVVAVYDAVKYLGGVFFEYVDWYKVTSVGNKHSYSSEKTKQDAKKKVVGGDASTEDVGVVFTMETKTPLFVKFENPYPKKKSKMIEVCHGVSIELTDSGRVS